MSCLLGGPESTSIGSRCRVCREAMNQPALGRCVVFSGRSWINSSFFTPGFYWKVGFSVPENTRHWTHVVLMLGQLGWWWPDIKTTMAECLVFFRVITHTSLWICLAWWTDRWRNDRKIVIWSLIEKRTLILTLAYDIRKAYNCKIANACNFRRAILFCESQLSL